MAKNRSRELGRATTDTRVRATLLLLAGVVIATTRLVRPTDATAVTEPAAAEGANPFVPSGGNPPAAVVTPVLTGGTVSGDTTGLYGGTLDNASCDPAKMVAFLQSHPDKAQAWAAVQGISSAAIPAYFAARRCNSAPTSSSTSAPTTPTCSYRDAGNGSAITARRGSTFTDTLAQTYRVGNDCELTHM